MCMARNRFRYSLSERRFFSLRTLFCTQRLFFFFFDCLFFCCRGSPFNRAHKQIDEKKTPCMIIEWAFTSNYRTFLPTFFFFKNFFFFSLSFCILIDFPLGILKTSIMKWLQFIQEPASQPSIQKTNHQIELFRHITWHVRIIMIIL